MIIKILFQLYLYFYALVYGNEAENYRKNPHIIYIMADDLGWNDVGFHGSNQIPTPNIDALAYRGIILNNYYVQPMCTPSRCALLTGKYPIHTGMQHFLIGNIEPRGLPLSEKLLPEYLKNLGYSTHGIGKWHIGFYKKEYTPEYRGFDSYIGHWTGVVDYYDHSSVGQGFWGLDLHRGLETVWDVHGRYLTELYTEEAVKIINSHGKSERSKEEYNRENNSKKPLFLYLSHAAVHSGNDYNPLPAPDATVDKFSYIEDYKRRRYAAILHWLDESVGNVVKALADNEMLDNSIIIFATDNGGSPSGYRQNSGSNWPLRGAKVTLWEGGTRGAASIWSPLLKKRGRVSQQFLHITDWLPTLLSAVNGTADGLPDIDGFDSWIALSEDIPTNRTEVLLNIDDIENHAAIRVGDWKVVIGTIANSLRNDWYGPSGLGYEHSMDLILNSEVSKAMDSLGYFLNVEQIQSLRESSKVSCKADNASLDDPNYITNGLLGPPIPCNAVIKPCLFNIKLDPCEKRNLAELYPEKLEELLAALERYNSTAIPPSNTESDPNANPALWGYTWTNYGDKKASSSNQCA